MLVQWKSEYQPDAKIPETSEIQTIQILWHKYFRQQQYQSFPVWDLCYSFDILPMPNLKCI